MDNPAQSNPFAALTPEQRAYAKKYVDAHPDASVQDVLDIVAEVSPQGAGIGAKIRGVFQGARQEVGNVLNAVNTLGGRLPGSGTGFITPDSLNPIPQSIGDAAALLASAATGSRLRDATGFLPSAARVAAPVAAGAAGDYLAFDDPVEGALWRTAATAGAEAVAGAYGAYKTVRAKSQQAKPDLQRLASTATSLSGGLRPVGATVEDIAAAGEGKPKAGKPGISPSLEDQVSTRFKNHLDVATKAVGDERVKFALPSGGQGSLKQALDEYAGLAEGRMEGIPGDQRAMAEQLWAQIRGRLVNSGFPQVANMLDAARTEFAKGMTAARLIGSAVTGDTSPGGKPLPPIVDAATGKLDFSKVQQRARALIESGDIDSATRQQLLDLAERGGRKPGQPIYDQPLSFNPGMWFRLYHGGAGIGAHPEQIVHALQMPRGVGPMFNEKGYQTMDPIARQILNLGSLLGFQNLGQIMRSPGD